MLDKYKIRVNTKAESKEAQELLFELGYYWAYRNIGKKFFYEESDVFLFANVGGIIGTGGIEKIDFFNSNSAKEITLPQLRDLVTQSKKEQGLISGAAALRALADGKTVEVKRTHDNEWQPAQIFSVSVFTDSETTSFRLKPRTIKLNGIEVPEPFEPKVGEEYWFIADYTSSGYSCTHEGTGINSSIGKWKSEDEIKQVVAALRSALTSK